jgi:hypothetical protein
MTLYVNATTVTGPAVKGLTVQTFGKQYQLGSTGKMTLLVVRNIGNARVWLGDRNMASSDDGVPLWPGDDYEHRSVDGLFAAIFGPSILLASLAAPALVGRLAWIEYDVGSPSALPVPGASFPWPDPQTV